MSKKASSLGGFLSDAIQDGIRAGIGDTFKAASTAVRKGVVSNAKQAFQNFRGAPGSAGEAGDFAIDAAGSPAWVSKLLNAPFGTHLCVGARGEGKSALCLAIGEARGQDVYMLDAPDSLTPFIGSVGSVASIRSLPEGSTVIIDDASRYIGSRRAMAKANVDFGEVIATARHRSLTLAINSQYASWVDLYALEVTGLWIKYPDFGWEEVERPSLHKAIKGALAGFAGMGEAQRKEWVYLYRDPGHYGMIRYSPPAWYTSARSRFRGQGARGGRGGRQRAPDRLGDNDAPPVNLPDPGQGVWDPDQQLVPAGAGVRPRGPRPVQPRPGQQDYSQQGYGQDL